MVKLLEGDDMQQLRIEVCGIPTYCMNIEECMSVEVEADGKPWYHDIKAYIKSNEYPPGAIDSEKKFIQHMAYQFFLSGEVLYKRNHDSTLLRCVDASEANHRMKELHEGFLGAHASGPLLACKIMRANYYWLTMENDCIKHVRTCHRCQAYQARKNAPPQPLHSLAAPWPFSAWGMDVIGLVNLKVSNGHEYILVAIDYFTKWVEATLYKSITQSVKFGSLSPSDEWCSGTTNKNIKKILVKMIDTYKDWHENLPFALCAYRTSIRTSTSATPYSLVYGMEIVLPVEVKISSLRILSQTELSKAEWVHSRYEQLNMIDEKHMTTMCHGQLYQHRVERAFNKKVKPRLFEEGDLVLKKRNQAMPNHKGKFSPTYNGLYVVKKAFSGGALIIAHMDGHDFNIPPQFDAVIWYFA
nr:uncharacterized protein LOC112007730 [Quercus suber]